MDQKPRTLPLKDTRPSTILSHKLAPRPRPPSLVHPPLPLFVVSEDNVLERGRECHEECRNEKRSKRTVVGSNPEVMEKKLNKQTLHSLPVQGL